MSKIYLVSFPRSGQHLTQQVLNYLFDDNNVAFSYCEFYRCCNTSPCTQNHIFQKNHDFSFDMKIDPNSKYVVLYRADPIKQLESYFRYECRKMGFINTTENLYSFIRTKLPYYRAFVNKWVNASLPNVRVFEYYNIINDPVNEYRKMIEFIGYRDLIKEESILRISDTEFKHGKIRLINDMPEHVYELMLKECNFTPFRWTPT